MLAFGVAFINLLILGLCGFWINRFLIQNYDPTVYILLMMFLGALVYCNVGFYRFQVYQRCFYKIKLETTGFECYDFWRVYIKVCWDEVRTCGVTGYGLPGQPYAFVYFSKIPNEPSTAKQEVLINKQRIVLQVRKESVECLRSTLPEDIRKRIIPAIERQSNCIYRR